MSKVKDLPIITSLDDGDIFYVIDDSIGVNGGRKITRASLKTNLTETAAEVKAKYESNVNTNEFSDAEKSNLANQSGTNTGDEVSATTTVEGVSELATATEVNTGTDNTRTITPLGLASSTLQSTADSALQPADSATQLNYTQTTPAYWTVADGSDIGATLDEVGSRVTSLEGGVSFVTFNTNTALNLTTHKLIKVDTSAGDVTLTLPLSANGVQSYDVWKISNDLNKVIVVIQGSDTIIGETSFEWKSQWSHYEMIPDKATTWLIK